MQLRINGESQSHPDGLGLAELVARMELNPMLIAVEVNRKLVPRSRHGGTRLNDNDELEIVTLVGGG